VCRRGNRYIGKIVDRSNDPRVAVRASAPEPKLNWVALDLTGLIQTTLMPLWRAQKKGGPTV
jgi:hypothetical protein